MVKLISYVQKISLFLIETDYLFFEKVPLRKIYFFSFYFNLKQGWLLVELCTQKVKKIIII